MLKQLMKIFYMGQLGYKYIQIFKKTFFHPFISFKEGYKQLSIERQNYSIKVLEYLNIEVKIIGDLPKENKILYTINHRSLLDIIVMESVFNKYDKNGTWIAKEELFDAIYGDFFKYSGSISVDLISGKGLIKFFKQIKKTLSKVDDFNIYIFPEGERYGGDGICKFQSGASKIAKANKLKVVPIFINEKLEKVFKDAPYKDKKVVEVFIGEIMQTTNIEEEYKKFMVSQLQSIQGQNR